MTCKEEMLRNQEWARLKANGSDHYKTGGVEPIDLFRDGGLFRAFALASIIKYSFRNRDAGKPIRSKDMCKIIDYAQKLDAAYGDGER
jgi:hypothetical protein